MVSFTPPSVFSGRGGRCGVKLVTASPVTSGWSCISGWGASPKPGGRRSAPSGKPVSDEPLGGTSLASPVTARGSAREPKVLGPR